MKSYKQLEAAYNRAVDAEDRWVEEYACALDVYETSRRVALRNKYDASQLDVSHRLEADGIEVYVDDFLTPARHVKCTARAIKNLRKLEQKIRMWRDRIYYLDLAIDCCDSVAPELLVEHIDEIRRGLAATGYSLD